MFDATFDVVAAQMVTEFTLLVVTEMLIFFFFFLRRLLIRFHLRCLYYFFFTPFSPLFSPRCAADADFRLMPPFTLRCLPRRRATLDAFLRHADAAMYAEQRAMIYPPYREWHSGNGNTQMLHYAFAARCLRHDAHGHEYE